MKRALCVILTLLLLQTGCQSAFENADTTPTIPETTQHTTAAITQPQEPTLPFAEESITLTFASGVGSWSTGLELYRDGTFSGNFSDWDMGDTDEDYPYGVQWLCSFSGRFAFTQVDEYTWSLTLETLETEVAEGEEWIEDGVKYIASGPYGLEESQAFLLRLPDTPADTLPEDVQMWWPYRFGNREGIIPETISGYALQNVATGYTFFSPW